MEGDAHIVLVYYFQLFESLYLFKIRMRPGYNDVEFRRKLHTVLPSQLFPRLFLLLTNHQLILALFSAVLAKKKAEFIVNIKSIHSVPSWVQFI